MAVGAGRPLLLAAALALLAAGCLGATGPRREGPTGAVALTASIPAASVPVATVPASVAIRLEKDLQVIEAEAPVQEGVATATLNGVPVGLWQVLLEASDRDGDAAWRGQTQVRILAGETTALSVVLEALPGQLALTVDVAGLPGEEAIRKARLHLSPGEVHPFERGEGTTLLAVRVELAPGSYDFKVDLYGDTFHPYNLAYEGYWSPLTIHPGKTTAVLWSPATGDLGLEVILVGPLPAPGWLRATRQGAQVALEWEPVPTANLAGYRVYLRPDPLDRFYPVGDTPPYPPAFVHEPADPAWELLSYAVTALDLSGREGYRSPPAPVADAGGGSP